MIVDLDCLKERIRDGETDAGSYGAYVEMEAFALIRELIGACRKMETEIIALREKINELSGGEPPYPFPAYDIPGESFYMSELMVNLYRQIFGEDVPY